MVKEYYGLVLRWNQETQEIKVVDGDPVFQKSIAVHELTLLTSIAEGQLLDATFGTFDEVHSKFTAITEAIPMSESSLNAYSCPIPDAVLTVSGTYYVSFALKMPVVASDGETQYKVLTTGVASFTVNASIAQVAHNPIDQDTADIIMLEINRLAERVTALENVTISKVLVDFTCALLEENGAKFYEYYKTYSDGSTARMRVPAAGQGGGTVLSDWLTILTFTEDSWLSASGGGYELAFGPGQTGFSDDRYMALLSRTGTETYKAGSDLTAAERNGYYTQADTTFIGSDGSIYLTSNAQYSGRLLLFGAQTFSSNFVKSIAIVGGDLFVTYVDGTTETLSATWTTPEEVDAKIRAALTWKDYTSAVKGGTK